MTLPSSWKLWLFTTNLIIGLILSQVLGAVLDKHGYEAWMQIVTGATMWCLCFIMINVGYEFTIDKNALGDYGLDYLIAMTAAGFPWIFVAAYFFIAVGGDSMPIDQALLIARFAAPTSAGILFSMLDAAGLRDTWVFDKSRILAIFDDLDTIILMIPLKVVLVGMKWELSVSIGIMIVLLVLAWTKLHSLKIPHSWNSTLLYAGVIAAVCKLLHYGTHHWVDGMEPIHIEVLLPAFVLGCIVDTPGARVELEHQRQLSFIRRTRTLSKVEGLNPEELAEGGEVPELQGAHKTPALGSALPEASPASPSSKDSSSSRRNSLTRYGLLIDDTMYKVKPLQLRVVKTSMCHLEQSRPDENKEMHQVVPSASSCSKDVSTPPDRAVKNAWGDDTNLPAEAEPESEPRVVNVSNHEAKDVNVSNHKAKDDVHGVDPIEEHVQTSISAIFMCLVGLSMPALLGNNAKDNSGGLGAMEIFLHVVGVSVLMILGKMFPSLCYRDEAKLRHRFALCCGMCPRGEVGASIIVISLEMGVEGPAIIIAMCALGANLVMSGAFISAVKYLLRDGQPKAADVAEKS